MASPSLASRFNTLFFSLLFLFIHIGCFFFTTENSQNTLHHHHRRKKRKSSSYFSSPSLSKLNPQRALSYSWCLLKRVFHSHPKRASKASSHTRHLTSATTTSFSSPRSSGHHSIVNVVPFSDSDPPRKRRTGSRSDLIVDDSLSENPFLPLRNDIFPCPSCGEIFQKPNLLEHHQVTKHAVSELRDGDSGKNVVWMIFKSGWTGGEKSPTVHRILKIHNGPRILARFEEYRETVKSRAARGSTRRRDERCVADGNELLRFHCTTLVCDLGHNGNSGVCSHRYCSACGIIRAGFSPKLDGIATLSSSWRAHAAIPGDVEAEFAFMNVKRAMLVCRVIAGRVGCDPLLSPAEKDDPGFDSLVGRSRAGIGKLDDEELLVFNPRAVLPCFLIVYTV